MLLLFKVSTFEVRRLGGKAKMEKHSYQQFHFCLVLLGVYCALKKKIAINFDLMKGAGGLVNQ